MLYRGYGSYKPALPWVCFPRQVGEAALTSLELMLNARKEEAAADVEGVGTEGPLSPGEIYSSKREWASEEFQRADAELKGEKRKKIGTIPRYR